MNIADDTSGTLRGRQGFTLIELLVVMIIVAVLAVMTLPKFFDISKKGELEVGRSIYASVKSGINIYRSNDLIANGAPGSYPAQLDAAPANSSASPANPFFDVVLDHGIEKQNWSKENTIHMYRLTVSPTVTATFTYNPATGQLSEFLVQGN